MILGITFFGVVPIAACIAYIVVKIYKLRERKKYEKSAATYQKPGKDPPKLLEIAFQGKPELSTETTRYEVHGEDLRYEMDGNETGHEMDAKATNNAIRSNEEVLELQAELNDFKEVSSRKRQELKGAEFSKELEVPKHQINIRSSNAGK